MNRKTQKPVWYENPKYYLAAILLVWGFKLLLNAGHEFIPSLIKFNGSILDGPLVVVLTVSLFLLFYYLFLKLASFLQDLRSKKG